MNIELAIALLGVAMEKGVPMTIALIKAFGKKEITMEDIQALRDDVKPPEEY